MALVLFTEMFSNTTETCALLCRHHLFYIFHWYSVDYFLTCDVIVQQMSSTHDGQAAILKHSSLVIPAIVALLNDQEVSLETYFNGAATLANTASFDNGIMASLDAKVPACLGELVMKVQSPQHTGSAVATAIKGLCAECFMQLSHHGLGKVAIRETGGINGEIYHAVMTSHFCCMITQYTEQKAVESCNTVCTWDTRSLDAQVLPCICVPIVWGSVLVHSTTYHILKCSIAVST